MEDNRAIHHIKTNYLRDKVMRRKSSLLFSFRKVKKGVNNLQNINWLSEIAKVIIISILTTVVLFIIRRLSPGNYDGETLA